MFLYIREWKMFGKLNLKLSILIYTMSASGIKSPILTTLGREQYFT